MEVIPVEQIELKLQDICLSGEQVLVRVLLFGGVEISLFGKVEIGFDKEDSEPYFIVMNERQYATSVRFYGQDIRELRKLPETKVIEIILHKYS